MKGAIGTKEETSTDSVFDAKLLQCFGGQRPIAKLCGDSWFVLKYLLGLKNVKNYDGSRTEYGNLIGAPIEQ